MHIHEIQHSLLSIEFFIVSSPIKLVHVIISVIYKTVIMHLNPTFVIRSAK